MFEERDSIRRNSIALGIFALITATLLATTHMGTKEQIAAAQRAVQQKALLEVIPRERHSNDMLLDVIPIPAHYWPTLGLKSGGNIHVARDQQGHPVAMIVPAVAPDGYNGAIHLIIGINVDGTIAGVRATEHNETPGLGDKVDLKKSGWVLTFNNKSLTSPAPDQWKVKKDGGQFDQFTGATITPRAVIRQVVLALRYFAEDKERLLKAAAKAQTEDNKEVPNNG